MVIIAILRGWFTHVVNPNLLIIVPKDTDLNGDVWSSSEDEEDDEENNLESVISKSIRWNDDMQLGGMTTAHAHTLPRRSLQEKARVQSQYLYRMTHNHKVSNYIFSVYLD